MVFTFAQENVRIMLKELVELKRFNPLTTVKVNTQTTDKKHLSLNLLNAVNVVMISLKKF